MTTTIDYDRELVSEWRTIQSNGKSIITCGHCRAALEHSSDDPLENIERLRRLVTDGAYRVPISTSHYEGYGTSL